MKTRDEVLFKALKDKGVDTVKDGKAIPFKDLVKLADADTKKKLRTLNIAQIVGYLYSAIVLGRGIPLLNIYMTNKSEAKRQAKLAEQKANSIENKYYSNSSNIAKMNDMYKPENLEFLSKHM